MRMAGEVVSHESKTQSSDVVVEVGYDTGFSAPVLPRDRIR